MKRLTDFELAAIGSIGAVVADLHWLIQDIVHAGRFDHVITFVGLALAGAYGIWGWIRHKKTGAKPVESIDDIDYRIKLYMAKNNFHKYCAKEKALKYLREK